MMSIDTWIIVIRIKHSIPTISGGQGEEEEDKTNERNRIDEKHRDLLKGRVFFTF